MTRKFDVWLILRDRPQSARELAKTTAMDYDKVSHAFKALQVTKAITLVERRGREAIYRTNEVAVIPEGRGKAPGSAKGRALGPRACGKIRRLAKESERRFDPPIKHGYGCGKIALEDVWR